MHNNAHGMGGKHIWPEIQRHISLIGRSAEDNLDRQFVSNNYCYAFQSH